MKTVAVSLLFFGFILHGFAQGIVIMNTVGGGVDARATNVVTGLPAGLNEHAGTWSVGLYWAPEGTTEPNSFTLVPGLASFGNTDITAGYVITSTGGGTRAIPGAVVGTPIAAQIRAWNRGFPDWETANAAATGGDSSVLLGFSNPVTVIPSTPLGATPVLEGLRPYHVGPIPEPSTISLAVIGGVSLLFFGRRRRSKRQA